MNYKIAHSILSKTKRALDFDNLVQIIFKCIDNVFIKNAMSVTIT